MVANGTAAAAAKAAVPALGQAPVIATPADVTAGQNLVIKEWQSLPSADPPVDPAGPASTTPAPCAGLRTCCVTSSSR